MAVIQFRAIDNRNSTDAFNRYFETNYNNFSNITKENLKNFEEFLCYVITLYAKAGNKDFEFQINTDLKKDFPEFFEKFENELGYNVQFYPLNESFENRKFNLLITW